MLVNQKPLNRKASMVAAKLSMRLSDEDIGFLLTALELEPLDTKELRFQQLLMHLLGYGIWEH
jgi:hypothetical protein